MEEPGCVWQPPPPLPSPSAAPQASEVLGTTQLHVPKAPPKQLVGKVISLPTGPVRLGPDGSTTSVPSQDIPAVAGAGGSPLQHRPAFCFQPGDDSLGQGASPSACSSTPSCIDIAVPKTPVKAPHIAPPILPSGWKSLWDEESRHYYYWEEATGRTTWECPASAAEPPQAQHAGKPTLPEGWKQLWDEVSKRYYYWEESSGATTWECPGSVEVSPQALPSQHAPVQAQAPAQAQAQAPAPAQAQQPQAVPSAQHVAQQPADALPSPQQQGWKTAVDPASQRRYFYQVNSLGETVAGPQWEMPEGQQQQQALAAPQRSQAQPQAQPAVPQQQQSLQARDAALPACWKASVDPASQKCYYYQVNSLGETVGGPQWERPECPPEQQAPVPPQRSQVNSRDEPVAVRWDRPECPQQRQQAAAPSQSAQEPYDPWDHPLAVPAAAAPGAPVLTPGPEPERPMWRRAWSEEHKREYWYNQAHESTWVKPPGTAFDV